MKKNSIKFKDNQETKKNIGIIQLREFLLTVNSSNCQYVVPPSEGGYRAFIGKGNNGLLVKSLVKTRPWWSLKPYSEIESCNLVWT